MLRVRTSRGLIADKAGNLYGTTNFDGVGGSGVVFELSPPVNSRGAWKETVLHSFPSGTGDGCYPQSALIADSKGNLYGTTTSCGASSNGTVFKLTPPSVASGAWTETVLYSFAGSDGAGPGAALIADRKGNLYGTTYSGGVADTLGYGTVFELTPPPCGNPTQTTNWCESVLYSFAGNLYGTTFSGGVAGYGTVFELTGTGFAP